MYAHKCLNKNFVQLIAYIERVYARSTHLTNKPIFALGSHLQIISAKSCFFFAAFVRYLISFITLAKQQYFLPLKLCSAWWRHYHGTPFFHNRNPCHNLMKYKPSSRNRTEGKEEINFRSNANDVTNHCEVYIPH